MKRVFHFDTFESLDLTVPDSGLQYFCVIHRNSVSKDPHPCFSYYFARDLEDCIREFSKLYPLHSILIVMVIDKYYLPSDNSDLSFEFELEGTNLGRELDCTNRLPQP